MEVFVNLYLSCDKTQLLFKQNRWVQRLIWDKWIKLIWFKGSWCKFSRLFNTSVLLYIGKKWSENIK